MQTYGFFIFNTWTHKEPKAYCTDAPNLLRLPMPVSVSKYLCPKSSHCCNVLLYFNLTLRRSSNLDLMRSNTDERRHFIKTLPLVRYSVIRKCMRSY